MKLTGTFLAPKQSCKVVELGVAEGEVDVDVDVGVVPLDLGRSIALACREVARVRAMR